MTNWMKLDEVAWSTCPGLAVCVPHPVCRTSLALASTRFAVSLTRSHPRSTRRGWRWSTRPSSLRPRWAAEWMLLCSSFFLPSFLPSHFVLLIRSFIWSVTVISLLDFSPRCRRFVISTPFACPFHSLPFDLRRTYRNGWLFAGTWT